MKRSEVALMVLQLPLDFVMLLSAGVSAYYLRFTSWAIEWRPVIFDLSLLEFISTIWWVVVAWLVIFALIGLYSTDPNRKFSRDITKVILACSAGLAVVAVYVMFTQQLFDSRFLVAMSWIFSIVYVTLGRMGMRGLKSILYRSGIGLRRVVIVGNEQVSKEIIQTLKSRPELGYLVMDSYSRYSNSLDKKIESLALDEMIFINPRANEQETLDALEFCNQHHIVFKYSADLFDTYSTNMTVHALAGVPIVELRRTPLDGWGRVVKRVFDVILSSIVLIVTSPLLFCTAIIILLETGRPIIYKNERIGLRGKIFTAYKFRSMFKKDSTGAQFGDEGKKAELYEQELIKKQNGRVGPIYKIINDPRVTLFGSFIRRWSIDELPQFINVLRGDMSIVGPRPHQPREVQHYEQQYRHVFTLKPGITGLAQISGRSDLTFEEEMKLDVFYIEKWSIFLDVIVFIKTPFIIFKKRKIS